MMRDDGSGGELDEVGEMRVRVVMTQGVDGGSGEDHIPDQSKPD